MNLRSYLGNFQIINAILENYRIDERINGNNGRHESQHNWVDEVVRCEAKAGLVVGNDVNTNSTTARPRPTAKDCSTLTGYEPTFSSIDLIRLISLVTKYIYVTIVYSHSLLVSVALFLNFFGHFSFISFSH